MLPVARNLELSNRCISHLLQVTDIPIIVIDDFGKDTDYIDHGNPQLKFIHNEFKEKQGLVRMWNQCIRECPTENVIIASWRPRPTPEHFIKIHDKLKDGFAFVALDALHFFAFNKYLTTKIGWFDTGFVTGQYEDTDTLNRLFINDLAIYVSEEIYEERYPSMWLNDSEKNRDYYNSKWTEQSPYIIQHKEEENFTDRDIYKDTVSEKQYRNFKDSELHVPGIANYYRNVFNIPKKDF
jgi:hypothetical protein